MYILLLWMCVVIVSKSDTAGPATVEALYMRVNDELSAAAATDNSDIAYISVSLPVCVCACMKGVGWEGAAVDIQPTNNKMDISLTVAVRHPYLYRQTDTHNAITALLVLSKPTLLYRKNALRPPKPQTGYLTVI